MRSVGIKTLKDKLSEYVRLVQAGEKVLVTDHDRVVAELVPTGSGPGLTLQDARLAQAVHEGWLSPPLSPKGVLPPRKPVKGLRLSALLRELDVDRSDR